MEFDPTPFPVEFDPASVYRSTRPGLVGRGLFRIRRLLNPILKLFFNPAPLLESVSVQSRDCAPDGDDSPGTHRESGEDSS